MNLNDFPDKVLCQIFDHLDLYEVKLASRVCRRWSTLTFSERRMDRVFLKPSYSNSDFLLNTKRNYRNFRQLWNEDDNHQFSSLVWLQRKLKPNVRVLDILTDVTSEQLRLLLVEAPELQHLSISVITYCNCGTSGPFPVLPKLTSLKLIQSQDDRFDFLRKSMPNLQSLNMSCASDSELKVWRHFSKQLKLANVHAFLSKYIDPFLELTFPLLEDLSMNKDNWPMLVQLDSGKSHDFFQRHPLLRKLSIRIDIPLECVESITRHCPELTYLHLNLNNPEEGFLKSLEQLTKLKHLSIDEPEDAGGYMEILAQLTGLRHLSVQGGMDRKMFRGDLKALEIVELKVRRPGVLLENLFEVAPQLNSLKLKHGNHDHLQLQFICENFSYLQHLEVNVKEVIAADNSVPFDGLALQELKISWATKINYIHHKTLRCLTISYSEITDDDLNKIPGKFPLLKRLSLVSCSKVSMTGVKRLHKLMGSCRIDYDKKRFYPVKDDSSK
ncbi:uncharacterized protein LOC128268230 [Anopheles cruzii]|uniref:uncharacterized protein LOC128268230 n=1 Tax=Anopheles cruzii TaxID=68878 RepID=UPI0022EC976C|nr:uncharacterized protein LOC128268230 [Anopheles cruzii]